mgnify:CR=1 FL=1
MSFTRFDERNYNWIKLIKLVGIYNTGNYPSDPSLIRVISIPQDIFGSGIKPGTFEISSSNYLIQDDGQGNLMDNKSITSSLYEGSPYTSNVYGGNTNKQGIHVGNIIYSHGMVIVTNEDLKRKDLRVSVIADISCDTEGPIASTIRASKIADPIYGYDPQIEQEVDFRNPNAIAVKGKEGFMAKKR